MPCTHCGGVMKRVFDFGNECTLNDITWPFHKCLRVYDRLIDRVYCILWLKLLYCKPNSSVYLITFYYSESSTNKLIASTLLVDLGVRVAVLQDRLHVPCGSFVDVSCIPSCSVDKLMMYSRAYLLWSVTMVNVNTGRTDLYVVMCIIYCCLHAWFCGNVAWFSVNDLPFPLLSLYLNPTQ